MKYKMEIPKSIYVEDVPEFEVKYQWNNVNILTSFTTKRGTQFEIVNKPGWGLTCYMNNSVQSCLKDERIYHESLVVPVMSSVPNPERVCIIGGGEGATLREVLKWPSVKEVDMYEWDKEVVDVFSNKYREWSQGAFNDPRVVIIYEDIFDILENAFNQEIKHKYDVIIVDLFEPLDYIENQLFYILTYLPFKWLSENGSMVIYSGMRNILYEKEEQSYQKIVNICNNKTHFRMAQGQKRHNYQETVIDIIPYKVYIPSFSGESTFVLLKNKSAPLEINKGVKSHLTQEVWNSYKTFNW